MPAEAIRMMTERLQTGLGGALGSILLYGSAALGDFRSGWSDIDLLVLTRHPIGRDTAQRLVGLRRRMAEETGEAAFRLFEGGMLSRAGFLSGSDEEAVYWGTSGERLRRGYALNALETACLLRGGRLLAGEDPRPEMTYPDHASLRAAVSRHLEGIRRWGGGGGLYACGWMLDIARGLYTLRTDEVIAKTAAGEWALAEGLAPDRPTMERVLALRREPRAYAASPGARAFCAGLAPAIARFADVLEEELAKDAAAPETRTRGALDERGA